MAQGLAEQEERPAVTTVLGSNVYRRRVLRVPRWSQDVLATASGVAVNTIRTIESARDGREIPFPQLDTVDKLARALGCESFDLLRWEPEATRAFLQALDPHSPTLLDVIDGQGTGGSPVQRPLMVSVPP